MRGRPKTPLVLTDTEREELVALTLRPKTAQALALRARLMLACADGHDNKAVAARHHVTPQIVSKWRARFVEQRFEGLLDTPRSGAPRTIDDTRVDAVIAKTLESVPVGTTHWSIRTMASALCMSQTAVSRIWRAFGLQPHRQETFKLSKDPMFVEKVRDIVGLYMDPPLMAMVLCVDEKSQIQALDRTQPLLPLAPGISCVPSKPASRLCSMSIWSWTTTARTRQCRSGAGSPGIQDFMCTSRPHRPLGSTRSSAGSQP